MLGAVLIHPDKRAVIPLMPEPIIQQDGTSKNDCERNAAKRLIVKLRQDHPHLTLIVTEDSLALLTVLKKWTFDLSMPGVASRRHIFEVNVNWFIMVF